MSNNDSNDRTGDRAIAACDRMLARIDEALASHPSRDAQRRRDRRAAARKAHDTMHDLGKPLNWVLHGRFVRATCDRTVNRLARLGRVTRDALRSDTTPCNLDPHDVLHRVLNPTSWEARAQVRDALTLAGQHDTCDDLVALEAALRELAARVQVAHELIVERVLRDSTRS